MVFKAADSRVARHLADAVYVPGHTAQGVRGRRVSHRVVSPLDSA